MKQFADLVLLCTGFVLILFFPLPSPGTDGALRSQLERWLGQYHVYWTGRRWSRPAAAGELQRVEATLFHLISLAGRLLRTEHVCRYVALEEFSLSFSLEFDSSGFHEIHLKTLSTYSVHLFRFHRLSN